MQLFEWPICWHRFPKTREMLSLAKCIPLWIIRGASPAISCVRLSKIEMWHRQTSSLRLLPFLHTWSVEAVQTATRVSSRQLRSEELDFDGWSGDMGELRHVTYSSSPPYVEVGWLRLLQTSMSQVSYGKHFVCYPEKTVELFYVVFCFVSQLSCFW